MKLFIFTCALVTALLLCGGPVYAEERKDANLEPTTELPVADMALVDTALSDSAIKTEKEVIKKLPVVAQPHTVADFIIHPFLALKPRVPEVELGKQTDTGPAASSPWQLFGFNTGQGLGSSVSSLADSVTGWIGNRIPFPGFVDTPVRESSTTTSTTTTRPDVVVRIQQRVSTKKPLTFTNNNRPHQKNKRPNHLYGNNVNVFQDRDDDEYLNKKRKRYQINEDDEYDDDQEAVSNEHSEENYEDEEDNEANEMEGEEEERPVKQTDNRRRRPKPLNYSYSKKRKNTYTNQRRRFNNKNQLQQQQVENANVYDYDDNDNREYLIEHGQQDVLHKIKYFTHGQTPTEVGNSFRKSQKSSNNRRLQQATLIINRNGQTIYVAPELLQVAGSSDIKEIETQNNHSASYFPQPPLTAPYIRKGQPTQYITIPWSKLGISPPNQIVSLTEGIQSQPLILQISQSAINNMQDTEHNKNKQIITPAAVPLLNEASVMDILQPIRIPPPTTTTTTKPEKIDTAFGAPVVIATKSKAGSKRIHPLTIVEEDPANKNMKDKKENSAEATDDDDVDDSESAHFIVIAEEAGNGKLSRSAYKQILDYFNHHRIGRQLMANELEAMKISQTEDNIAETEATIDDKIEIVSKSSVENAYKGEESNT